LLGLRQNNPLGHGRTDNENFILMWAIVSLTVPYLYRYIIVAVAAQNIRIYQNKRTIIMYLDTEQ